MVKTDFTDSCEWISPRADHQPTKPVPAWYRTAADQENAAEGGEIPELKHLTTIGTGGKPKAFYPVDTEEELVLSLIHI